VPTFKEKGFNIVESLWRGIMVKKGTSNEVLTKLTTAIANVEKTPEWRKFMAENAQSSMNLSVDQMQEFVKNEIATRKTFLNQMK
jgi:tripartite-type tricarboxylate transporter receptor subunit TctC